MRFLLQNGVRQDYTKTASGAAVRMVVIIVVSLICAPVHLIISSESNAMHNALRYVYYKIWSKHSAAQAKNAALHTALQATVSIGLNNLLQLILEQLLF